MYDKLDKALNHTRSRLIDVCHELEIDINDVELDDLLNTQCVACSWWGNRFTEMVDDKEYPLCNFCDDMDSLRF